MVSNSQKKRPSSNPLAKLAWKQSTTQKKNEKTDALVIHQSKKLHGHTSLAGAKNATLVMLASLILTEGKSVLKNIPASTDVLQMLELLRELGAEVFFDRTNHTVHIDTSFIQSYHVCPSVMKKMRASVLVMGPLLARFGKAKLAMPGGCLIGARPIDLHLRNMVKLGANIEVQDDIVHASTRKLRPTRIILEYPSVGATENIAMASVFVNGTTTIVNASLEPEVTELLATLCSMGAHIDIETPATIHIKGVSTLRPITREIMPDRLEAGALLLAAAMTGGTISLPNARHGHLDAFLCKLEQMGHTITLGPGESGIALVATDRPQAISLRTAPYPGFPTDLQAPMMAALCLAEGKSVVHEAVFEHRFLHIRELQKMGAQIVLDGDRAYVSGVDELFGTHVIASDIRASCALALAGLAAKGKTIVTGVRHWKRGYDALEEKLQKLGAQIVLETCN